MKEKYFVDFGLIWCLAWLRGTRKDPPALDETIVHETKRQQLAEKVKDFISGFFCDFLIC